MKRLIFSYPGSILLSVCYTNLRDFGKNLPDWNFLITIGIRNERVGFTPAYVAIWVLTVNVDCRTKNVARNKFGNTRLAITSNCLTVEIVRYKRKTYSNNSFSHTSPLWDSLPIYCFPATHKFYKFIYIFLHYLCCYTHRH